MNDKDKEAFEKWWDRADYSGNPYNWDKHSFIYFELLNTWQAACEYKQQEIDEYKEAARSEAQLVNELQAENTALRANINGTRMKQMNERIEELLIENAKLEKKVQRTKLFLKERLSYAHEDKDELFVNKYCLMALLQELEKE